MLMPNSFRVMKNNKPILSQPATSSRSNGAWTAADERFNVTHTPHLASMSRPVITVGARVTELEDRAAPLFGGDVPAPRMQFSRYVTGARCGANGGTCA